MQIFVAVSGAIFALSLVFSLVFFAARLVQVLKMKIEEISIGISINLGLLWGLVLLSLIGLFETLKYIQLK